MRLGAGLSRLQNCEIRIGAYCPEAGNTHNGTGELWLDNDKRPIVVKRIKKVAGGAHGGAWKIAYADFVTAMMAFFLLMWLLGSTSQRRFGGYFGVFQDAAHGRHDGRVEQWREPKHD